MEVQSVAKAALDYLRKEIITGGLEPGQKLIENDLAVELNISRHPLREAFRVLSREGLVESVPRRGTFVTDVSQKNFEALSIVREMLECKALSLLEQMENPNLTGLQNAIYTAKKIEIPKEYMLDEYFDCHNIIESFHFQLIASTENMWLQHLYKSCQSCIARYQFFCLKKRGIIKESIIEHENVFNFIENREYAKAEKDLKKHIYKRKC